MENQEKQHKRRVRYKGTHPRNYQEKYKELNPEKYKDTVEKVIRKGSTPAGMRFWIFFRFSRDRSGWMQHWDMEVIPVRCCSV